MEFFEPYLQLREMSPYLATIVLAIYAGFVISLIASSSYIASFVSKGMETFVSVVAVVLGLAGLPYVGRHLIYILLQLLAFLFGGFWRFLLHLLLCIVGFIVGLIPFFAMSKVNCNAIAKLPIMQELHDEMEKSPDRFMVCCEDGVCFSSVKANKFSTYTREEIKSKELYDSYTTKKPLANQFRTSDDDRIVYYDSIKNDGPAVIYASDIAEAFVSQYKEYKFVRLEHTLFCTIPDKFVSSPIRHTTTDGNVIWTEGAERISGGTYTKTVESVIVVIRNTDCRF